MKLVNMKLLPYSGMTAISSAALLLSLLVCCGQSAPPATPVKTVVDTLHGVEVVDNYRWLENGESEEVENWENLQDKYCRELLMKYPRREILAKRIDELMKIGFVDSPCIAGGRYFYLKREGLDNHAILYLQRQAGARPEAVINPNTFSTDGTVALDWWHPSTDGRYIAYGKSSSGTENSTLFIVDVDAKEVLRDTIPFTSAASVAWLRDNSGFYYTRYPEPGTVPKGDEDYFRWIYYHKVGTDYHSDSLIFGPGRDKTDWPDAAISPDNKYLLISVYMGWAKSEFYLMNLAKGGRIDSLTPESNSIFMPYMSEKGFYILTNYKAPHYRVMWAEYSKPQLKHWREIIPEDESIKEIIAGVGDYIVISELKNASSQLMIYSTEGKPVRNVVLPEIGTISREEHGLGAEYNGTEVLFAYNSYFIPPRIYRYDFTTNGLTILDEIKTDIDLSQFEVHQVWFPSKDGTPISMFLTHRKGLELSGANPTLLYGYGGFSNNETPFFSGTMTMFLKDGGVFAHAQIRGGGEYGEKWHRAGMLENKQNVFDDFIAACEWLIANKYTNRDRLAIEGESNGGLLVGAVLVQRPDLMKAVVCSRPLLDMLRYHKFLIGGLWVPEYGSSDNPDQFKYLYAYSPYQHVKPGVAYPAVLFESADHDTRVDPLHARKMTAALQAATISDNPILLRIQRETGHGQGAPRRIILEEVIDEWCFIYWQLGM
jgi:prolyl oligopeptidase